MMDGAVAARVIPVALAGDERGDDASHGRAGDVSGRRGRPLGHALRLGYSGSLGRHRAPRVRRCAELDGAARWLAVAAVLLAAVYQLTPLKDACLRRCRSPLGTLVRRGSLQAGIEHGAVCLGCCWALMLALIALGIGSMLWMVALAAVVLVEKVAPLGERAPALVAAGLVGRGGVDRAYELPHRRSLPGGLQLRGDLPLPADQRRPGRPLDARGLLRRADLAGRRGPRRTASTSPAAARS